VVIAETQTRGRGRLGRSWTSPPFRNLYLSLILRPAIAVNLAPQLALVAGAAATRAIRRWSAKADLKWPNDVLIDGRKVCGILAEMEAAQEKVAHAILGIGVNLNMQAGDFPPDLRGKAIGLQEACGATIDRAAFTVALLAQLESSYDRYLRSGFAALRSEWESLSSFFGRRIEIVDGDVRRSGTAVGLTDTGALRLRSPGGDEVSVVAGDVTVVEGYAARN
jgi:BirA family biotin operon repressor/biotin-[acetyl-CoA-carboxylase] ligase